MENTRTEKKQEIQNLINRMYEEPGEEDVIDRNMSLCEKLSDYGSQIVDLILDKFFERKRDEKFYYDCYHNPSMPIFPLLKIATEWAKPKHAKRFAGILSDFQEFFTDKCMFERSLILDALKNIGNKSAIPFLKRYAEMVKEKQNKTDYISRFQPYLTFDDRNIKKVLGVLAICGSKLADIKEQEEIAEVIAICEKRQPK